MQYCSYSIGPCFYHQSHPQLGIAFALAPSLHCFWSYFSTDLFHLLTWGVPLSVSYHFAFSYCSWGSQGKNTEVVCRSLLQWTILCQQTPSSNNTREDSTHEHHQMVNTKIRLIIFFAAKDGKVLYNKQKQDQELTVARIINSLLPKSDLN